MARVTKLLFTGLASVAIASTLLLVACSKSVSDGPVARSNAALVTFESDAGLGTTNTTVAQEQEPSGAFANARTLVIGFNTQNGAGQGWAVSTDLGVTFSRQCDFLGTNLNPGDGGLPCTAAVPLPKIPSTAGWKWSGDPTVVADGQGNVVFVSLANGTSNVAATVSSNGAATWDNSYVVNDLSPCAGGRVDQPNAVFDYTTSPPTLHVVWRWSPDTTAQFTGQACIRSGVLTKDDAGLTAIHWLTDPEIVGGLPGPYIYGVAVAAGDGVVTVMVAASNTSLPGVPFGSSACPDNGGLFGVDYAAASSFDLGLTWVDNGRIFHTDSFQWCVIGGAPGVPGQGFVQTGLRSFGLARAPGGTEYAYVQDSRHTARLFMSPAGGIKGYQNPFVTVRTWSEWCPGTPTATDASAASATMNWKSSGTTSTNATPCTRPVVDTDFSDAGLDLAQPVLAANGRGDVMFGEIVQVTPGIAKANILIDYEVRGITNPQAPGAVVQGPIFLRAATFPLPTTSFFAPRQLGDYGWLAVRPSSSTVPFWSPGCTSASDFFPMWTAQATVGPPDAGAPPVQIITRGITLTP